MAAGLSRAGRARDRPGRSAAGGVAGPLLFTTARVAGLNAPGQATRRPGFS
jgi:hypothetical protein